MEAARDGSPCVESMFVLQCQKVIIEKTVQVYLFSSKLAQTNNQTVVCEQEPGSASIVLGRLCGVCVGSLGYSGSHSPKTVSGHRSDRLSRL